MLFIYIRGKARVLVMGSKQSVSFAKKLYLFFYNHNVQAPQLIPRYTCHLPPTTSIFGKKLYFFHNNHDIQAQLIPPDICHLLPTTGIRHHITCNFFLQSIAHKLKILDPSPIYTTILHFIPKFSI